MLVSLIYVDKAGKVTLGLRPRFPSRSGELPCSILVGFGTGGSGRSSSAYIQGEISTFPAAEKATFNEVGFTQGIQLTGFGISVLIIYTTSVQ